ncbi:MAG: hypothetical protein J0L67_01025 [Cytophagales bacterium]|nr:hypothetical protein [Cytophagales bacterium]
MTKIEISTHILAPIDRCFDLARCGEIFPIQTHLVHEDSNKKLNTNLLDVGQRINHNIRYFGIHFEIESVITRCIKPYFFSDEMKVGPFHTFVHDHFFYSFPGETVMIDNVYFRSRWGVLGETADTLLVKRNVFRFLKKKNQLIKKYAESDQWQYLIPMPVVALESHQILSFQA